jgi:DNA-binding transcriptional MerR regulator
MSNLSRSPVYNLNAVLKETGLKADLLRAWERRYEMPKPQRTAGGHRLYSEYDIATIKWLRDRQTEGLSISRAVELWKEITQSNRDPFFTNPVNSNTESFTVDNAGNRVDHLRASWLKSCLAFDNSMAEEVINEAFALYPVETVCVEILQKGINEIGQLWYRHQATAQQEHFASNQAVRRFETLLASTPPPTRRQTILIGCPEGEWHTLPVLFLNLILRRNGLNVINLGASIPLDQLEQTSKAIKPSLVILAAQRLDSAAALQSAAILFRKLNIPMAYGGGIFTRVPELCRMIPAYYLGERLDEAIEECEKLAVNPVVFKSSSPVNVKSQYTASLFRAKLLKIQNVVRETHMENELSEISMVELEAFFTSALLASLELGDPAFMESDLKWAKKLLVERNIPTERMISFLKDYQKSIDQIMGANGSQITDWLDAFIKSSSLE